MVSKSSVKRSLALVILVVIIILILDLFDVFKKYKFSISIFCYIVLLIAIGYYIYKMKKK
ncbi:MULTISPECIES: hypothetical protein [Myroides]|uniref:Uncharacterized protein n=1 Tax=Myroides albus TaxID=2562892 RepID=A0A6I3LCU4_9FLAO|nr:MULTISPECIES: hypothetical protein [Myroides]MTG97279.1 hypothetical protein [Myroides albus]MVX34956.1 hypothetical protein [Myroides sp. LoEW2-1]UVD80634.1 hypothetical protein NWE55_05100 [Myroides albus]